MDTGRYRYYVVKRGRKPGIYTSWEECNEQVYGFKDSHHKGFMVRREAEEWGSLPRQDPVGNNTVPESQELVVSFGDLTVGESDNVTGDGSSGSGTAATSCCFMSQVGPLVFFQRDGFRSEGKKYHGFGISLQSTAKDINFFVSERFSTDERLARQDAAFITLERFLEEAEVKIFDFNFQVVLRYKEELAEAQRVARLSVTEHVLMLENENTELKQKLGLYNQMFM
ncbi:Ribonuclease H [Arachis hypogaea]|nr:Ribonuclease H [Arachis hypogaea]